MQGSARCEGDRSSVHGLSVRDERVDALLEARVVHERLQDGLDVLGRYTGDCMQGVRYTGVCMQTSMSWGGGSGRWEGGQLSEGGSEMRFLHCGQMVDPTQFVRHGAFGGAETGGEAGWWRGGTSGREGVAWRLSSGLERFFSCGRLSPRRVKHSQEWYGHHRAPSGRE